LWSGLQTGAPGAEVGVLGVPFDGAVCYRKGAAQAPAKLRALTPLLCSASEEGQPLRLGVRDYGDVTADLDWPRYFREVERRASEVLAHRLALFLGGDHSVSIPLLRAFDRRLSGPFGLLYVDAHFDLFDVYDGHPWSHACTVRRALELPGLDPEHVVFVGARSFSPEEREVLQVHPEMRYYTARRCAQQGLQAVAEHVVAQLQDLPAVYVSIDIDALDPAYAPGTGMPEAGGLTTRDLLDLVRVIFARLPVRAMDVVEVAPPLDHAEITSFAALKVVYEAWAAFQEAAGLD
jgi:agmatinase